MHTSISREMRPTAWCFCADPRISMAMPQPDQWESQGKWQSKGRRNRQANIIHPAMRHAVRLMRVASVLRGCELCGDLMRGQAGTKLEPGGGWWHRKASDGRGRVGTTCPISTHSSFLSTSYPIPFLHQYPSPYCLFLG